VPAEGRIARYARRGVRAFADIHFLHIVRTSTEASGVGIGDGVSTRLCTTGGFQDIDNQRSDREFPSDFRRIHARRIGIRDVVKITIVSSQQPTRSRASTVPSLRPCTDGAYDHRMSLVVGC